MDLEIRGVRSDDIEAVHEILLSEPVLLGTMRLPYESLEYTRGRLQPEPNVIKLVAVAEDAVVGFSELITHPDVPRHQHAGQINMIATHEDWHGRGVGRSLMNAMTGLADSWLQLSRLELTVWTTNGAARALYESCGFEIEGTLRGYVYRDGEFVDAWVMGRIRPTG